ncbi:ECF-type sigma factor [Marinicella sp. W31]|uniref:ECF-type sigma factor n=1 Tax=Marinicella sp. W31 TaxID=3023713 RepID=UPI00375632B5
MAQEEVTYLLEQIKQGDRSQLNKIYDMLYHEIKQIAGYQLNLLNTGETITPTVLAHECYLKFHQYDGLELTSKRHFLRCLAKSMRMYLIDVLRAKSTNKRKGDVVNYQAVTEVMGAADVDLHMFEIDRLLDQIEVIEPKLAEILQYKLMFQMTFQEISQVIGMSERQVMRLWQQAKAMLLALMHQDQPTEERSDE